MILNKKSKMCIGEKAKDSRMKGKNTQILVIQR